MKKILITNDDGKDAPALDILREVFSELGRVVTVAPSRPMSAMGNSLTLHKPVRINNTGKDKYSVTGTPADCVRTGILTVMEDDVDLVVSGINDGANLGDDVNYSGTVAAAREGALLKVPSLAVSLLSGPAMSGPATSGNMRNFSSAAGIALKVAKKLLKEDIPKRKLLNLNVPDLPDGEVKGIKITRLGIRIYERKVRRRQDPLGRDYYWIIGEKLDGHIDPGTDFEAVSGGYASLTPLTLDSTDGKLIKTLKNWDLN
ncbi:MAG: 5'/3'-nucleotidase SurE [Elusimicrobia bacterium]|nr:5'/3'-nucleotidase SurE [Elusimicrobiota bacterium]